VQEKRRYERKPADFVVEFATAEGVRTSGICRDISVGGMRIQTPSPAPFGAEVTVYAELAGTRGALALPGVVRWAKDGEMGVQFGMLGARQTNAITQLIDDAAAMPQREL
jgi:hypothetical protein